MRQKARQNAAALPNAPISPERGHGQQLEIADPVLASYGTKQVFEETWLRQLSKWTIYMSRASIATDDLVDSMLEIDPGRSVRPAEITGVVNPWRPVPPPLFETHDVWHTRHASARTRVYFSVSIEPGAVRIEADDAIDISNALRTAQIAILETSRQAVRAQSLIAYQLALEQTLQSHQLLLADARRIIPGEATSAVRRFSGRSGVQLVLATSISVTLLVVGIILSIAAGLARPLRPNPYVAVSTMFSGCTLLASLLLSLVERRNDP